MLLFIDKERRLSLEEHYCLYRFKLQYEPRGLDYNRFSIDEELIDAYNQYPYWDKVVFENRIFTDPDFALFSDYYKKEPWKYEKPVLWADRVKTPYFIQQLTESHAFEVYIDWRFKQEGIDIGLYYGREEQYHKGETQVGIEIKYDKRSAETGNYYIEYQERMHKEDQWANSGILKQDNTVYFLYGTMRHFVLFRKADLVDVYNKLVAGKYVEGAKFIQEIQHQTSKGILIQPILSNEIAVSFEEIVDQIKNQ